MTVIPNFPENELRDIQDRLRYIEGIDELIMKLDARLKVHKDALIVHCLLRERGRALDEKKSVELIVRSLHGEQIAA